MKVESLEELESAFSEWRSRKKHVRERLPEELRARAQRATNKHGVTAVVRVTQVERTRLFRTVPGVQAKAAGESSTKQKPVQVSEPTFSRVTLNAPPATNSRPIAEVEMSGVTLRVFEQTPEMMGLLSAACSFGAAR
jgi:hypothetical protein